MKLSQETYQFLRDFIARQTGIELGPDRQYLVESRLSPLLQEQQCPSLAELCVALQREHDLSVATQSEISKKVIHALSTHETSFFRDPDLFAALRSSILPNVIATNSTGRLRIWSAAASSGQEAYSLAILMSEMGIYPPPQIIATDISALVLDIAAKGHYTDYELLRGVDAPVLRQKYFIDQKGGATVKAEIKQSIQFQCHDLRDTSIDFSPLDLILCRNVLIYFEEATRLQVLQRLRDQLRPGGFMILGSAEAIWVEIDGLSRISNNNFTYYMRNV